MPGVLKRITEISYHLTKTELQPDIIYYNQSVNRDD